MTILVESVTRGGKSRVCFLHQGKKGKKFMAEEEVISKKAECPSSEGETPLAGEGSVWEDDDSLLAGRALRKILPLRGKKKKKQEHLYGVFARYAGGLGLSEGNLERKEWYWGLPSRGMMFEEQHSLLRRVGSSLRKGGRRKKEVLEVPPLDEKGRNGGSKKLHQTRRRERDPTVWRNRSVILSVDEKKGKGRP